MVYSLIKAIALLFAAVSAVNASDAQNDGGLRDMDVDYAHRELWEWGSGFSWNWNILLCKLHLCFSVELNGDCGGTHMHYCYETTQLILRFLIAIATAPCVATCVYLQATAR